MGNRSAQARQPPFNPSMSGWEVKEKGEEFNVWRHQQTGEEIEEYRRVFSDQRHFNYQRDMFTYRLESDILVASKFFREETQRDMCSTFYKGSIYLERIPLRLTRIKEIPFPDVLHLYHQAFRGFAMLFDKVGYFEPTEGMIGINAQSRVKVWLSENFAKSHPDTVYGDGDHSEANMVRSVVNLIHTNTDERTLPENILDTMRRQNVVTFREADTLLQEIATRHNQTIPAQLDCVAQMRPELMSRFTSGEPAATIVPGLPVQPGITVSNVQPVTGLAPQSLINTATFTPQIQRNFSVPSPSAFPAFQSTARLNNLLSHQQGRHSFMLPSKPATAGVTGVTLPVSKPVSTSYVAGQIGKPYTALPSNRVVQGTVRSNPVSRTTLQPQVNRTTVPLPTISERVSVGAQPRNINVASAMRTVRGNVHPGKIQINIANTQSAFKTAGVVGTSLPVRTTASTLPTTTYTDISANTSSANRTIAEVEQKNKDAVYTSPEIMKMLGISEEKTGRFDTQTTKKEVASPIVQPITHTSAQDYKTSADDFLAQLNSKYNYSSYETTKATGTTYSSLPKTESATYTYTSTDTKPLTPKIEFVYSSTNLPRNDYTSTIYGNIDSREIRGHPAATTTYTYAADSTSYQTKVDSEPTGTYYVTAPHSFYTTDYTKIESEVRDYQIGTVTSGTKYDYDYTSALPVVGSRTYKADLTGTGISETLPESRLAATMTTFGLTNSPGKANYEVRTTEEVRINTGTNYTSTEEIYKVTESFMASGSSYSPAFTTSIAGPSGTSSYNYTSALPSLSGAGLSSFGTYVATSYSPRPQVETAGISPTSTTGGGSYNVAIDNELLKDLEMMRSGMFNKPVATTGTTTTAPAGEFISTLSFGANSQYVRDSIRSGTSQ